MNSVKRESSRKRKRRIRAEAAVWVVRLHSPDRNAATEAGLRLWLSEDEAHAAQFELATDLWSDPAELAYGPSRPVARMSVLASLTAVVVLAAVAFVAYFAPSEISTGRGERKAVILADGTKVELNTDTRIAVRYSARQRELILKSGEAYFNVTKHQSRPFVVVVGDRKVVATGTSFMVRREDTSDTPLAVTLIEGCVAIEPTASPASFLLREASDEVTILNAGERAKFGHATRLAVDRPSISEVTSWREGELSFTDAPLREAVAELNRYSLNRITVKSVEADSIKVNGVFRTEDSFSFIRTVANAHHMELRARGDELILESVIPDSSEKK